MSLAALFGYLGCMLLVAALASWYAARRAWPPAACAGIAFACAAFLLIPAGGLTLAEYLRSATGDLSIVSQAMLAAFVAGAAAGRPLLDRRQVCAVMAAAFAGAVFLYPAALGLLPADPYALGFASLHFAAALAALTLLAWWLRFYWLAACLLLAVSARLAGALESRNLWDYLLDPLLALYAACWLFRMALKPCVTVATAGFQAVTGSTRSLP